MLNFDFHRVAYFGSRFWTLASCCLVFAACSRAPRPSFSDLPRPDAVNHDAQFYLTGLRFEERHHGERVVCGSADAAEGTSDELFVSSVTMFRKARDGKTLEGPFFADTARISLPSGAASFTSPSFQRGGSECLGAPGGTYDPESHKVLLEGPVELKRAGQRLCASGLSVDLRNDAAHFMGPVVARHEGRHLEH